ncbi:hypothetical protein BGZ81_003951 [Podila clonocystis]|nr:hypothetical protein BGZ81_003951 [Podila clonocystis]
MEEQPKHAQDSMHGVSSGEEAAVQVVDLTLGLPSIDWHALQFSKSKFRAAVRKQFPQWQEFISTGRNEQAFSHDKLEELLSKTKVGEAEWPDAIPAAVQVIHKQMLRLKTAQALIWSHSQKAAQTGWRSPSAMYLNEAVEELLNTTQALLSTNQQAQDWVVEVENKEALERVVGENNETGAQLVEEALKGMQEEAAQNAKKKAATGLEQAATQVNAAAREITKEYDKRTYQPVQTDDERLIRGGAQTLVDLSLQLTQAAKRIKQDAKADQAKEGRGFLAKTVVYRLRRKCRILRMQPLPL